MEGLLKDGILCATAASQLWPCHVFSGTKGARGQSEEGKWYIPKPVESRF